MDNEPDDYNKKTSGASTSKVQGSPSKKNVEISITLPGAKNKRKGWYAKLVFVFVFVFCCISCTFLQDSCPNSMAQAQFSL